MPKDLIWVDKLFSNDSFVEGFVIDIPKDNLDVNSIHFHPQNEHCKIFIKIGEEWKVAETKEFGSYLLFDVSQDRVEVAVVEHTVKILPIVILSVIVLVVIASAIVLIILMKKRAKDKAPENTEKDADDSKEHNEDKKSSKKSKKKK